jgi:hypothetical protein
MLGAGHMNGAEAGVATVLGAGWCLFWLHGVGYGNVFLLLLVG